MAKKRPERARTLRRNQTRQLEKLAAQRDRLFALEPGGAPERPIDVSSASLVEPRAAGMHCPRCDEPFKLEAHNAPSSEGMRLREAVVRCPRCGQQRSIWFRLTGPALN
jgi:uncharacterized C2H2 Zn-finger protein